MRAAAAALFSAAAALLAGGLALQWARDAGLPQPGWWLAVLVAPWLEEGCKWLAARWCKAGQGATGLGFGLIEGGLKLLRFTGALSLVGLVVSVVAHWAYGRWAARRGFGVAAGLHLLVNATAVGCGLTGLAWLTLVVPLTLALALLLLSFPPALDVLRRPA